MSVGAGAPNGDLETLVRQKLEAFDAIEGDFLESFRLVSAFHGEQRFERAPVSATVRYLRALWLCERKDRLLDVARSMRRYEGQRCLELLLAWQNGDSSGVVIFLGEKLGDAPIAELTRQIAQAETACDGVLAGRLSHGRMVALNRSFNLALALDAILAGAPEKAREEVVGECAELGLQPERITDALASLDAPIYGHVRHRLLAERNMLLMNSLGSTEGEGFDAAGGRTRRVERAVSPLPAGAETPVEPEVTLSSMAQNNPAQLDLAMPTLAQDAPGIFDGAEGVREPERPS